MKSIRWLCALSTTCALLATSPAVALPRAHGGAVDPGQPVPEQGGGESERARCGGSDVQDPSTRDGLSHCRAVRLKDLDLHTASGGARLRKRMRTAVRQVCGDPDARYPEVARIVAACEARLSETAGREADLRIERARSVASAR